MKNLSITIIIVIVFLGGVFFFSLSDKSTTPENSTNNDTSARQEKSAFSVFADISLEDYEGASISLGAFEGKPLVINSWAVWCPFCREELPAFSQLQKEFGDELIVIAIDRQESREKAQGYTDGLGITDDMLFLLDARDSFYKRLGGFSMPETIFVNSEGEIVVHKRGPMNLAEMREHTQKIITSHNDAQ
ncbi:MAG: TlpA disulfide reductase family protein [Candidatus Paceibacterota bacterium]